MKQNKQKTSFHSPPVLSSHADRYGFVAIAIHWRLMELHSSANISFMKSSVYLHYE